MRTPRHVPTKNTRTRDLRDLKFSDLAPFVEQLMNEEYIERKHREAEETQWD